MGYLFILLAAVAYFAFEAGRHWESVGRDIDAHIEQAIAMSKDAEVES